MKIGKAVRPLLPEALATKVPKKTRRAAKRFVPRRHPRKMLMLAGCVQPAMAPNVNDATIARARRARDRDDRRVATPAAAARSGIT